MFRIIDPSQSAFIKNMYILDNVVLSQEILHSCQISKQHGVVIKVNFEKFYNKIHWDYLLKVLYSKNFGTKWIQWITHWLYNSQSCILINDALSNYLYCKRGVR